MSNFETNSSMLLKEPAVHRSGEQRLRQVSRRLSPVRALLIMALSIFLAETFVMISIFFLPPFSMLAEALFDSALLIVLLSPMLYFFCCVH